MFIQTEDTPNPATMKFLPGCDVAPVPVDLPDVTAAHASPLAQALFAVSGVQSVFLGVDFISVTRKEEADWTIVRPALLAAIMDHFVAGRPVLLADHLQQSPACAVESSAEDADVVARIQDLLNQRIRPAVAQDGGDVAFERYEDGVVYLRLKGACAGCPSATATLKFGIEQMLRHFIPEVQEVRRVL